MFTLNPQLARDTFFVTDIVLCRVLLMNNSLFPWLILVPMVGEAREIIDLDKDAQYRLMDEIAQASDALNSLFVPDKLNVAALGNQVAQLHVHVIARFKSDTAWPNPVWGGKNMPYKDPEPVILKLRARLSP